MPRWARQLGLRTYGRRLLILPSSLPYLINVRRPPRSCSAASYVRTWYGLQYSCVLRTSHVPPLGEPKTTRLAGSCHAHWDLTTAAPRVQTPRLAVLDGGDPSRLGRADDIAINVCGG